MARTRLRKATRPAAVVGCLALLQACAGSRSTTSTGSDRPGATTTSSTTPPAATSTTRKASAPVPATPHGTTAPGPAATSPGEQRVTATTAAGDGGASGPPGAYARTLLRRESSGSVSLDVIVQSGASLRSTTTDHLLSLLTRESANAPSLVRGKDITASDQTWSPGKIVAAADSNAGARGSTDRPAVHVLALHGGLEGDANAIGVAVRGDVFAVFVDHVRDASTPLVPQRVIEDAVAVHELGHLLGLVDLALNRHRGDPDHPGHSTNRGSVMYWAIDSDLVTQVLDGAPATDYDQEDRADLATLRSGG